MACQAACQGPCRLVFSGSQAVRVHFPGCNGMQGPISGCHLPSSGSSVPLGPGAGRWALHEKGSKGPRVQGSSNWESGTAVDLTLCCLPLPACLRLPACQMRSLRMQHSTLPRIASTSHRTWSTSQGAWSIWTFCPFVDLSICSSIRRCADSSICQQRTSPSDRKDS